jgi:hypothetical protein
MVLHDWHTARARLVDTEAAMVAVLDELDLTDLVTSIPGLSAVGAAAILAETGDLTRFPGPRSVVKHAGLCPRDKRLRPPPRQDDDLRPWPTRAAPGRLAGSLGGHPQQHCPERDGSPT